MFIAWCFYFDDLLNVDVAASCFVVAVDAIHVIDAVVAAVAVAVAAAASAIAATAAATAAAIDVI